MNNIDNEKIINLVKSQGWQEFKKLLQNKRLTLADKLIYKPKENLDKEVEKIKVYDEIIALGENIYKSDFLKNKEKPLVDDLKVF